MCAFTLDCTGKVKIRVFLQISKENQMEGLQGKAWKRHFFIFIHSGSAWPLPASRTDICWGKLAGKIISPDLWM